MSLSCAWPFPTVSGVCAVLVAASVPALAASPTEETPPWLLAHVGEGPGQIAGPVLQRARALYRRKVAEGSVSNPCYFAMDATRPNDDAAGGRFYVVCEAEHSFNAIAAGHGAGRDLNGAADFANGRLCARHFGNAADSELTAGGVYVTSDIRTSFKGYYRASVGNVAFVRSFIQFEGEGETANARQRDIGGHAAAVLKNVCLLKDPSNPHASAEGYVPFGKLVDYSGGRSNGCTSWSSDNAAQLAAMVKDNPTTLYIYPDAEDIRAVTHTLSAGRSLASQGLYWNSTCLKAIGAPRYWSRDTLEPIIARFKRDHPPSPPRPTPLCTGN